MAEAVEFTARPGNGLLDLGAGKVELTQLQAGMGQPSQQAGPRSPRTPRGLLQLHGTQQQVALERMLAFRGGQVGLHQGDVGAPGVLAGQQGLEHLASCIELAPAPGRVTLLAPQARQAEGKDRSQRRVVVAFCLAQRGLEEGACRIGMTGLEEVGGEVAERDRRLGVAATQFAIDLVGAGLDLDGAPELALLGQQA